MRFPLLRRFAPSLLLLAGLLAGCADNTRPTPPPAGPAPMPVSPPTIRVGLALGGGAAKGFAHIGVIKMLEANGVEPAVVAGTSAGSVVGALYASGMDAFEMQQRAVALDAAQIRDVSLFSGGLIKGQALQDYVNAQVGGKPLQRLGMPFAAVATRLETGERVAFARGNTGQAVRASSSVPGVFEPVEIGGAHYVDGGVVSPVPVDAARELGADVVIAVDISDKAGGQAPTHLLGIVNQSLAIMGQKLGAQEMKRAEVVIRPDIRGIGATDFEQRARAIVAGEKAALAALPEIRAAIERERAKRVDAAREAAAARAKAREPRCVERSAWLGVIERDPDCSGAAR